MLEGFRHEMGEGFERAELGLRAWFRIRFIERVANAQDDNTFKDTADSEQALKARIERSVARFMAMRRGESWLTEDSTELEDRWASHAETRPTDMTEIVVDEIYEVGSRHGVPDPSEVAKQRT